MNNKVIVSIAVLIVLFLVVMSGNPFYVVPEGAQVVITRLDAPVGNTITNAGLKLKIPFIDKVNFFEKRILEWDGYPDQIPTRDKRYISVDTTARWRISDALKFFKSVHDESGAHAALDDIIDAAVRRSVNSNKLISIVRSSNRILDEPTEVEAEAGGVDLRELERITIGRDSIREEILSDKGKLTQYGIELIDVRIKRVNYIEDVKVKVYERMIAERKRAAEQYRSEGRGVLADIQGSTEKELKRIRSEAYRTSQELKGHADAKATKIYAQAYSKDPEFYAFMKTLETYQNTIDSKSTVILTTDSEYFKYLKGDYPN